VQQRAEHEARERGPRPAAAPARGPLLPEAVLALQATAGNRAVAGLIARVSGGARTLQRFTKPTADYTEHEIAGQRNLFETQSEDPVVKDDLRIRHMFWRHRHPKLTFADDDSIAIHAPGGHAEAKEFFATDAVIDDSNARLKKVGSAVRLKKPSGQSISVGETTLWLVEPGIKAQPDQDREIGDEASFATHICIEVAMKVIGKLSPGYEAEAVFESEDLGKHTERIRSSGKGSKEVAKLADHLGGEKNPDFASIGTALGAGGGTETANKDYGKLGKKRRRAEAVKLGINEFANPKVGEGIATYSARAPGGDGGGRTWGYHYAGVVARSGDGADYVTLENYNRGGDVEKLVHKLYFDLYKRNKEVILARLAEVEATDDLLAASNLRLKAKTEWASTLETCLKAIVAVIKENEGETRVEAQRQAAVLTQTRGDLRWFFRIYGSNKGQSFHEQMAKSGYFVDPITLRVRKPR
jgi:hypothetical protein